jgi:hypothetical protein
MHLERGGDVVVGAYYYAQMDWTPILISGRIASNGTVRLSDKTESHDGTSQLSGKLTASGFLGIWTANNQRRPLPARLTAGSPPECEDSRPWKRFNDTAWPITFSYPAAMRLSVVNGTLTLTCPDPASMEYYSMNLRIGQGDLRDLPSKLGFQLFAGKWMYGTGCDAESDSGCREATVRHEGKISILNADDQEWRIYCRDGGYVGQGEGQETVLLVGDRWVDLRQQGAPSHLIERIITTAKIRPAG